MLREEVTSAKAGFHASSLLRSNWNLEMFVFVEGGKQENRRKTLGAGREPTTNSSHDAGSGNRTRATLAGGRRMLLPPPHTSGSIPRLSQHFAQREVRVNVRLGEG